MLPLKGSLPIVEGKFLLRVGEWGWKRTRGGLGWRGGAGRQDMEVSVCKLAHVQLVKLDEFLFGLASHSSCPCPDCRKCFAVCFGASGQNSAL